MFLVHIVISDRNWILERLASELAKKLDYVSYDTEPDPTADIQYYMTYGARRSNERVSPLEIAFFTHLEERHEDAKKWFFDVAESVDHCVCMSRQYAEILNDKGVQNVTVISPGVDTQTFTPKLKIGVVGRTYATGRKGEDVVEKVMDIPEIEWHFTGAGWPQRGKHVPEALLPDFYRSMDYILVPAYYEGGPMCVLEALACGCEVIAPPVGWVPDYPHIEFKVGDAEDLRQVLLGLLAPRKQLAASVASTSWDRWASGHDKLFRELGETLPQAKEPQEHSSVVKSAGLWVSQIEKQAKGGPTVRVANTLRYLRRLGVNAMQIEGITQSLRDYSIIHAFNISPPEQTESLALHARTLQVPVVVSPILLDYSERQTYELEIPEVFAQALSPEDIDRGLAAIRKRRKEEIESGLAIKEHATGLFDRVQRVLDAADHIISLSSKEKNMIEHLGTDPEKISVVYNPAQIERFAQEDPKLFENKYGVTDFILCVARKEARKNQLGLLYALRESDIPIVLIGHRHEPHETYLEQLDKWVSSNVLMIERLDPNDPILASAYAASRVFVLPSFSEGASLAVLEAASAGCNLVLSDRSSEQEYFGSYARFCDPSDPESIRAAVLDAYENPPNADAKRELKEYVVERFSYERYARDTLTVYEETIQRNKTEERAQSSTRERRIYVDLTTGGERSGSPTGVTRAEREYAIELKKRMPSRVQLVKWYKPSRKFIPVTLEQAIEGAYTEGRPTVFDENVTGRVSPHLATLPHRTVRFVQDSILLVMGSSWNAQNEYLRDLVNVKRTRNLKLITCMYDIMPVQFPHFTPESYAENFGINLNTILKLSDRLVAISNSTKQDVMEYSASHLISVPEIDVIRLGDELIREEPFRDDELVAVKEEFAKTAFVLSVSTITPRKNFDLLYQLWLRLLSEHGEDVPHLVIVGKEGYNASTILTNLARDVHVQKHIHVLTDVTDVSLAWLYRNCLLTVYPTLYEGWGLPVAESLAYSKVTIASDVASIPEIASELTDLVDPVDFIEWYATVSSYIFDEGARKRREKEIEEKFRPTSWESAAEKLAHILDRPFGKVRESGLYKIGTAIDFSRSPEPGSVPAHGFQGEGWSHAENEGTWTLGSVATLSIVMRPPKTDFIILSADVKPHRPKGTTLPLDVELFVNGTRIAEWFITERSIQCAVLPVDIFQGDTDSQSLQIEFQINNPRWEFSMDETDDPENDDAEIMENRLLGLRFTSLEMFTGATIPAFHSEKEFARSAPSSLSLAKSGWSYQTTHGLCTTGGSAVFIMPIEKKDENARLLIWRVEYLGFRVGLGLELDVFINGQCLAQCYFVDFGPHDVHVLIRNEVLTMHNAMCVEFRLRDASPTETFSSGDGYPRGIAIKSSTIVALSEVLTASDYSIGRDMAFGLKGSADEYLLNGWCLPQPHGTWTMGGDASLFMRFDADSHRAYELAIQAKPFLNHLTPVQDVDVIVNDETVANLQFEEEETTLKKVTIPTDLLKKFPCIYIRLQFKNPVSLKELGLGIDDKPRSLFVEKMRLTPVSE